MSTTPVTVEAGKGAEFLQAVREDHDNHMGTVAGESLLVVPLNAAVNSTEAPFDGMVAISVEAASVVAYRIGDAVTAVAGDFRLPGPNVWYKPIFRGERVSLFGIGAGSTASVSMVLNRG